MRRRKLSESEEPLINESNVFQSQSNWDVFEDPVRKPEVGSTANTDFIDNSVKVLRFITIIVTFIVVLTCAIISKGTLLFMTSQIKKNTTRAFCNENVDKKQQFVVSLPEVERAQWMWLLIFAYFLSELIIFLKSVRICFFKSFGKINWGWEFAPLLLIELCPAFGSALLIFIVLPELDVIKGAMITNACCFIPGLLGFITRDTNSKLMLKGIMDILCLTAQASAFVVWPLLEDKPILYVIPPAILLISMGWAENFISKETPIQTLKAFAEKKMTFKNEYYAMYMIISPLKCILFFVVAIVIIVIREGDVDFLFSEFGDAFSSRTINVTEIVPVIGGTSTININDAISSGHVTTVTVSALTAVWVWLINISTTYICYAFAKYACKVLMQGFCFAFPLTLAVPVLTLGLIIIVNKYNQDYCAFSGTIPNYLFFNMPTMYLDDFLELQFGWIWLIWLISQAWITIHIWDTRSAPKLGTTVQILFKPTYDPFLIDQSLVMNKRKNYEEIVQIKPEDNETLDLATIKSNPKVTRIFACGTMWHETKEEMMEFLKSILRLDYNQSMMRIAVEQFEYLHPDYFELETHIFFDDAFVRKSQDDNDPHVNDYVLDLISSVSDAASEVHEFRFDIQHPVKTPTPYGGRLTWTLPGKTKMIAHLKDKAKIRPKKRWSQVMYMYYLLGHRLIERNDISPEEKEIWAKNTYLLALDGDIDFQPQAVHLLIDYMKKNEKLGAACGRIHPIGEGAMAWYQMFEYAVGHWLQKATEHVIGCVLCSPGCFSLFRGKALMDNSVMKKYTTLPTEPIHYVQYDQGEDRWLCTLLLQQGYRVEYSAASDSFTHCPEGFNEFYNQRRRWMPSTTANIIDLLNDSKHTIETNDNISLLYIIYQTIMLIGTVLGPGTIFLMLVGAFVAAFKTDQWTSFMLNLIPIVVFILVCATCKTDTQLFFAGVISAIYGLIMMAVLVGVALQIKDDGFLAPSSLFFFVIALEFIIAALLHPSEFNCLKYGVVYYVTVPSMYMLLVIYSVFNMNNVSWGTREVTVKVENKEENIVKTNKQAKKDDVKNKVLSFFGSNAEETAGSIEFSCAGIFKILCCTHKPQDNEQLIRIQESLKLLDSKIDHLERLQLGTEFLETKSQNTTAHMKGSKGKPAVSFNPNVENINDDNDDTESLLSDSIPMNSWIFDTGLENSEFKLLDLSEEVFFTSLIDKYLYPLDETSKKAELEKKLKDLKDKVAYSFLMINSLFVLVVFLLTLEKDTIHLNWPINPKINFTYVTDSEEIKVYVEYLQLEPIGFVFVIFFALLMVIQFIAMLIHRFGTFTQLISNITINWSPFPSDVSKLTKEEVNENNVFAMVKSLTNFKYVNSNDRDIQQVPVDRRKTVANIALKMEKPKKEIITNIDDVVAKSLEKSENDNSETSQRIRRQTKFLRDRRDTIIRRETAKANENKLKLDEDAVRQFEKNMMTNLKNSDSDSSSDADC